jgi:hypothetical protein
MKRLAAAVAIGVLGSVFIWIAVPYNNFVLGNSYISDDYMPVAALFVVLVLVLGLNPLLRRACPRLCLDRVQLAVVFGMLLVACITPSQGLLRELPYAVAGANSRVASDRAVADLYEELQPPASLFPDPLIYDRDPPASGPFLLELLPGESIPWRAWLPPLLAWSGFLVPWWLMMIALAAIVWPQWRENERLPFPLLGVQEALIEAPEAGHCLAPIFRNRAFWMGCGSVFALHLLAGLQQYFPDNVPAIPLAWDLSPCFAEEPLQFLPHYIKANRLHFMFLGVAFFMPKRIGFSIWFLQVAYAVWIMLGTAYRPPFRYDAITDHRIGAFIAVPLGVLWLGRTHWARVLRTMVRRVESDPERSMRWFGYVFAAGCLGMMAWLLWVGVPLLWSLGLVVMGFFYALAITRVVAETGLPLIGPDTQNTLILIRIMPLAWRTAAAAYFGAIVGFFIGHGNRLCVTTLFIHALGLNSDRPEKSRQRLLVLLTVVLLLSVVVCGAAHLVASYTNASTVDGRETPISSWGTGIFWWTGESLLREFQQGMHDAMAREHLFHIGIGTLLAGGLQWLCQLTPHWPLHPVALLFIANWYAHRVWFNVFLGWLAKVLILRYGGSRCYTGARPFFTGLIMGEVMAMAFWAVVTGVLGAAGLQYRVVEILPF